MDHPDPREAEATLPEKPPPPERRSLRSQLLRAFVLVAAVPVVILGVVNVFDDVLTDRSQILVHLVWVVVAVSLSFLLARILADRVTRPLEGMVQRVRELSINGQTVEPPVPATAPAEIGGLAEVAEEMALGFHEAYARLQEAVAEREDLHAHMQLALTDERRARQAQEYLVELSEARDVAEAASRFKSALLASTSHEIRTPMNGIVGMVELLLKSPLNERQRQYAEAINHSSEALLGVIDDLLDLAKIEAGKLTLKEVDYSPREVAERVVAILEPRAKGKDLELGVDVDPEVPPWLRGDAGRLRQVLLNLVGNALKFTEAGKVEVVLEREAGRDGAEPSLRFAVRDTGIGIAERDQENLFQPFSQAANSSSRRLTGTGLGLAISRQLVELMGGEIGMKSALGEGSTFFFRIPLEIGKAPEENAELASGVGAEAPGPARNRQLRILVVEDNKINQLVLSQMLKSLGYPHDIAEHGVEALSFLARETYELVLMDCQMPELDGYETTQRIRSAENDGEHLTIVALTAHATHGEREKCLAAGMDDYLAKPLRQKQLVATLDRWLSEA